MTVSSTTSKNTYSGTGSQTIFAYTFRILDEEHILVQIKDTNGTITNKTLTTDYTVAGVNSDNGGNVTFVTAPLATDTIILTRNIPIKQEVDYQENDTFPAETHEGALDKLTMVAQQLKEESDRTVKVDAAVTGFDATLPSPEANKIIGFNANGDGLAIQNLASLGTVAINGSTVNGMVKYTGPNELTIDSGTVYDGTTLTVTGNVLATNSITSDGAITALGSIFVGGEVDGRDIASDGIKLDNIESGADVTDEANVTSALSGATLTAATVAGTDKVLVQDADDSDNLKTVTAQSIADLAGGGGGAWSLVSTATASSSATIEFTGLSTAYVYRVVITDLVSSVDGGNVRMRTSTDNGTTFDSTAGDYGYVTFFAEGSGTAQIGSTGATSLTLTYAATGRSLGNATGETFNGFVDIYTPSSTGYTYVRYNGNYINQDGEPSVTIGTGVRNSSADVDAIQFYITNGTITSGTFKLYALAGS